MNSSKKRHVHYTDIEKKTVATCLRFATSNTVRNQFYHYLLPNGYVERVSRGIYKMHACMPGKEVIGGILVIIFSILSIVIGGGFIIGLILGIIGGILGLAKK